MSKIKKKLETVENEDVLQAVLLADNFNSLFDGYTNTDCSVLFPLVNFPLIEYSLNFLVRSGVQETIIFCCSHAELIRDFIKNSKYSSQYCSMVITVIVSERCLSLGDCMRDLDSKAVLRGDFILLSPYTVCYVDLLALLDYHKCKSVKDKGTAMTLVVQDVGATVSTANETVVAVESDTNKLLFYNKPGTNKKIQLPIEHFASSSLTIYSKLRDAGIAVCSQSVPLLFSDNFDFQTKEDFIRGVLINEEILDSRIYCYELLNEYGTTVHDWPSYQRAALDAIQRWTFPSTPDTLGAYKFFRNNVYKEPNVQISLGCNLERDVVIGRNTKVNDHVVIVRSVIGPNCLIGKCSNISNSFVLQNTKVAANCHISLCVIGENVTIKENVTLTNCFIKANVVISSSQEGVVICSEAEGSNYEKLDDKAYIERKDTTEDDSDSGVEEDVVCKLIDPEQEDDEEDGEDSSLSDDDMSYTQSIEHDDTTLFFNEVVDSLQRGFEEKLNCENLILEINSSRYAYNVSLSDVNQLTVKAILCLAKRCNANVKTLFIYFMPLFNNYIKNEVAMRDSLLAFEEMEDELGNELTKSLHYLYDKDVLSEEAIISWSKQLEPGSDIQKKIAPLIKWFEEASSEDED